MTPLLVDKRTRKHLLTSLLREQGVGGSNQVIPTSHTKGGPFRVALFFWPQRRFCSLIMFKNLLIVVLRTFSMIVPERGFGSGASLGRKHKI